MKHICVRCTVLLMYTVLRIIRGGANNPKVCAVCGGTFRHEQLVRSFRYGHVVPYVVLGTDI